MSKYNTTQLDPETSFERHVYHRDQFAHYLRWTYVLKESKIGNKILDWGCGSGNCAEVLYRNMHKCSLYIGLDIRKQTIKNNQQKFSNVSWMRFEEQDLVNPSKSYKNNWDFITCFEVLEHIGKENADKFLKNISENMEINTKLLLSTPNYDEKVGAADNHIINGVVGEFKYDELKILLEKYFVIEKVYGTFASIKDYKYFIEFNSPHNKAFEKLREYYDSNLVSVIMAPLIPAHMARNCLWVCKLKEVQQ